MGFDINITGILNGSDTEDIKLFVKDFFLVFSILEKLDEDFSNQNDKNLAKFKELMKDWEKKYRDIIFSFKQDSIECTIKIYFKDAAENIIPVIERMSRFQDLKHYKDRIEAIFDQEDRENTLTIKIEGNLLRLIYLKEDMLNSLSPEFRLCAYYAMKNGFNREISLTKYIDAFSFDASELENNKWSKQYSNISFQSWKR